MATNSAVHSFKTALLELTEDGRGWILLAVAAGWFLSLGIRLVFPAVLPQIRTSFGLDLSTSGLLLTTLWLVYALGQLPGGVLSDKIGSGTVLALSTTLAMVAVLAIAMAPTTVILFAGTALLGICTALYGPARFPMLSAIFSERDGIAIGSTQAAGNLGSTLLPLAAGTIAGTLSWQFGFGFAVPLFVIVAAALWIVVPNQPEGNQSAVDSLSTDSLRYLMDGLSERSVGIALVIQVLGSSMYQGFTSFYPTYLVEIKGLSPSAASKLFALFFAMGMVVQPTMGATGDWIGERRALLGILSVATVALAVLPFITSDLGLVVVTIVLSSLLGRGVLTLTYLTNVLAEDIRGTGLGVLRTGYITVGAASPLLIGILADNGYFDEAFLILSGAGGIMVLFTIALPERE